MRSHVRPALGLTAAAVAAALLLSGCGEQASGAGATSSSAPDLSIDASIGTEFSGGSAGAADQSATPVKVGMINQEGGSVSNPEGSAAVQAAFDYINAQQKGIGGHPLQLELCKVTSSEEEAQQCAQKFLNDDSISVVLQGGLNVGANAVHQTLGGSKPDVVIQANNPDAAAQNTFAVNPSFLAALPGTAKYASSQGFKTVGIVVDDNPGDIAIAQIAQHLFEAQGISSKVTTFPVGTTDLTSAYTAALADNPDAIAPIVVTTAGCIASAKALDSIGTDKPVIASALCATDEIKAALGDFPKWAYESTTLLLFAPDETGQLDFYQAVMAQYAGADAQLAINAPASFGSAFLLAKVLNTIGPDAVTPAAVTSGMQAYTDGVVMGTPKVAFGSIPDMPALSGVADRIYVYKGNDDWSATDWQNLPQ